MLNSTQIQELIPHRFPFLFLDKVEDVQLWESAVGVKCFTINEHFFAGHFPNHPVVPGVILIEAMAQLSTLCVAYSYKQENRDIPNGVAFMSIKEAKFRQPVIPGDQVKFEIKKIKQRGSIFQFAGTGHVDGNLVIEAEFMAMSANR